MEDVDDNDNDEPKSLANFQQHASFIANLERAQKQHKLDGDDANAKGNVGGTSSDAAATLSIEQLLQMGETAAASNGTLAKPSRVKNENVSKAAAADWEEVAESTNHSAAAAKRSGDAVITTIRLGGELQPKKPNRNQLEMAAQIKRTINRRKKELQVLLHKTHLLCWIAHGNHTNRILNSPHLMSMCLKFMPSKYTYPKSKTDRSYFEQIIKWYGQQMRLDRPTPDAKLSRLPPLAVSLALQLRSKVALCQKSYVLMFAILLRAIGVQCRLVLNLAAMPLRPPQSELLSTAVTAAKVEEPSPKKGPKLAKLKTDADKDGVKPAKVAKIETSPHKDPKVSPHFAKATSRVTSTKSTTSAPKASTSATKSTTTSAAKSTRTSRRAEAKAEPKSPVASPHFPSSAKPSSKPSSSASSQKRSHPEPIASTQSPRFVAKSSATNIHPAPGTPLSKRTRAGRAKPTTSVGKMPQLDGADDDRVAGGRKRTVRQTKQPPKKVANDSDGVGSESDDDSDFESVHARKRPSAAAKSGSDRKAPAKKTDKKVSRTEAVKRIDRRLVSTENDASDAEDDANEGRSKKVGLNMWLEVFVEANDQWMCVDLFKQKVDSVDSIRVSNLNLKFRISI